MVLVVLNPFSINWLAMSVRVYNQFHVRVHVHIIVCEFIVFMFIINHLYVPAAWAEYFKYTKKQEVRYMSLCLGSPSGFVTHHYVKNRQQWRCPGFQGTEWTSVPGFMVTKGTLCNPSWCRVDISLRTKFSVFWYIYGYSIFSHIWYSVTVCTSNQKSCAIASLKCLLALLLTTIF